MPNSCHVLHNFRPGHPCPPQSLVRRTRMPDRDRFAPRTHYSCFRSERGNPAPEAGILINRGREPLGEPRQKEFLTTDPSLCCSISRWRRASFEAPDRITDPPLQTGVTTHNPKPTRITVSPQLHRQPSSSVGNFQQLQPLAVVRAMSRKKLMTKCPRKNQSHPQLHPKP